MKTDDEELRFFKDSLITIGGILIAMGIGSAISMVPLSFWDKIILFICGGILIMQTGYYLYIKDFKTAIKNMIIVIGAFLVIFLLRIFF